MKSNDERDLKEDKVDLATQGINSRLESPEAVGKLIKELPNASDKIENLQNAIGIIRNPDSSPLEIIQARSRIANLKGDVLEQATKDSLRDCGFNVQDKVEMVKGENGNTIPDVVATNNTDEMIRAFGREVQPGETLSCECKCGNTYYIKSQLEKHIPNQLSGQLGYRTLVTTSDISAVKDGLAQEVCHKYDAVLVTTDLSAAEITSNLKGAIA